MRELSRDIPPLKPRVASAAATTTKVTFFTILPCQPVSAFLFSVCIVRRDLTKVFWVAFFTFFGRKVSAHRWNFFVKPSERDAEGGEGKWKERLTKMSF